MDYKRIYVIENRTGHFIYVDDGDIRNKKKLDAVKFMHIPDQYDNLKAAVLYARGFKDGIEARGLDNIQIIIRSQYDG